MVNNEDSDEMLHNSASYLYLHNMLKQSWREIKLKNCAPSHIIRKTTLTLLYQTLIRLDIT